MTKYWYTVVYFFTCVKLFSNVWRATYFYYMIWIYFSILRRFWARGLEYELLDDFCYTLIVTCTLGHILCQIFGCKNSHQGGIEPLNFWYWVRHSSTLPASLLSSLTYCHGYYRGVLDITAPLKIGQNLGRILSSYIQKESILHLFIRFHF